MSWFAFERHVNGQLFTLSRNWFILGGCSPSRISKAPEVKASIQKIDTVNTKGSCIDSVYHISRTSISLGGSHPSEKLWLFEGQATYTFKTIKKGPTRNVNKLPLLPGCPLHPAPRNLPSLSTKKNTLCEGCFVLYD